MVTGDRQSVAEEVASKLNIDEVRSGCLPETKVEFVENVKRSHCVAVVGDGVNDAPALAAGDLGVAMGAIGSDIAINSASIALMTNDLRRIAMLVFLSRKSQMIINQNLLFGMLFVFGGMILSMVGVMTPIWAAVLHAGSTLIIIFNLVRSRSGRAIMALRDNRIAAESVGITVTKYKMMAFVTSAALAGAAGALFALGQNTIVAAKFDFNLSILVLVFVVLGGLGNMLGSVIAATALTILPEALRGFADYRMLIYAIVLILVMLGTNNPQLKGLFSKLLPHRAEGKEGV